MRRGAAAWDRRNVLAGAAAIGLFAPVRSGAAGERYDALVSRSGGAGGFRTLAAALAAAPAGDAPWRIRVARGIWREKLVIRRPNVTVEGEGPGTVLVFGASAGMQRPDGAGPWGTGGSASLTVEAPGVSLRGLTIRNDFDFLGARRDPAGNGAQAVALSLAAGADRTSVADCAIEGYQDTLYAREGRARFRGCTISGGTDFVFGGAAALFDRCRIVSRHVPDAEVQGFVAAPSTPAVQPVGLVFRGCRLEREAGVPDASVWLGRPWRAGGNMALTGAAAILDCWMDGHVRPEGWTWMGYRGPDGEQRRLTPQEARLVERGSRGPGAAAAGPTRRMVDARTAAALIAGTDF